MATVKLSNIQKYYDEVHVVKGLDLEIASGKFISLLGPSGCGKTTTLRMIAGLERASSGEVRIGDRVVSSTKCFVPPEERDLGMVFQSYAVWPHMNVFENIAYPLKIRGETKSKIKNEVERVIELVKLNGLAKRKPDQLSGGQQQRVALARALVMEPKVLLLDEPLSNLDAKLREDMRLELKAIQRRLQVTVVYVTHDQSEAMVMSDQIAVMNGGVIEQWGAPADIYKAPKTPFVADFIGAINFLETNVVGHQGDHSSIEIGDYRFSIPKIGSDDMGQKMLAVRLEDIELKASESGKASIAASHFFGDLYEYHVDLGDRKLKVRTPSSVFFQEGQRVDLDIKRASVF